MWQLYYFAQGLVDRTPLPETPATKDELNSIFNLIYITLGALALFLVVLSGFRYVMAQGDPQKIASAKSTIIYTLVGLVAAASATAIVQVILRALEP